MSTAPVDANTSTTTGPPAQRSAPREPRPASAAPDPVDAVTPQLCAAAHLQASFAEYVHDELVGPAPQAVAPNWNIDAVLLARHAEQARARRARRDVGLVLILALVLGLLEVTVMAGLTGRLKAPELGQALLAEAVLAYCLAFAMVWWHYSTVHRSAIAVMGAPGVVADEPASLDPRTEQDLTDETEANVVLFSGLEPFIGSGTELDTWSLTTDISLGRTGPDGVPHAPEPFDALELQSRLLLALPRSINPRVRSGRRLYVFGRESETAGRFFRSGPVPREAAGDGRFRRPVTTITEAQMDEFVRESAISARPYAFFELTGWGGEVVVTLFVRVVVDDPVLFVEIAVCALRPLRDQFADALSIPLGPRVHHLPVLRSVAPRALPLLLCSPARTLTRASHRRREANRRRRLEQTLARRRDLDFSALSSLREDVAGSGNDHHFGYMDEEMFYRLFSRRSLDCIRDFLKSKNVDTTDFEKQQTLIVQKTVVHARDIYGSAVSRNTTTNVSAGPSAGTGEE